MAARNINAEQFHELLKGDKPLLVDFWAPWCSYCRRINPAYEKVAAQFVDQVEVVKINIDDEGQLANLEQIEVIPTLVIFRGGAAVNSVVAPDSKAAIDRFIAQALEQ